MAFFILKESKKKIVRRNEGKDHKHNLTNIKVALQIKYVKILFSSELILEAETRQSRPQYLMKKCGTGTMGLSLTC